MLKSLVDYSIQKFNIKHFVLVLLVLVIGVKSYAYEYSGFNSNEADNSIINTVSVDVNNPIILTSESIDVEMDNEEQSSLSQDSLETINEVYTVNQSAKQLYELALEQYYAGDRMDALTNFNEAIAIDPLFFDAYIGKSRLLFDLGRYNESILAGDLALQISENATVYYLQAQVYEAMEETERALWSYSKACQIDPNYVESILDYTSMLLKHNDIEDCMEIINEALKNNPSNESIIIRHSEIHALMGRFQNAINDMNIQIAREPNNMLYVVLRGQYKQESGDPNGAMEDLYRSVEEYPVRSWYYIGLARKAIAQQDSAVYAFEQLLKHAHPNTSDSLYINKAGQELYTLNQETDAPFLRILNPSLEEGEDWLIPAQIDTIKVSISAIDRSYIKDVCIGEQRPYFTPNRRSVELTLDVPIAEIDSLHISVMDEYNNLTETNIPIVRLDPFIFEFWDFDKLFEQE